MAEITRKRTGEHLRRLFGILQSSPEGLAAADALKKLKEQTQLTAYEAGKYEGSDQPRFYKIVRFATVDAVKAGWLLKAKGHWTLTEAGIQAYNEIPDPEMFYKEATRLYRQWRISQPGIESISISDSQPSEQVQEKSTSVTFEQAEETAWADIEAYLRTMKPFDFQDLVADLLSAMGYHVSWVSPPGKDGGVDIIAFIDPLGTQPPRIKVQVKRVNDRVDVNGLKSFLAIVADNDVGLYVSTGGFTRDAEEFARSQERRKITLINLDKIVDLWISNYNKLTDAARRRLPLTPIYFLTPQI